MSDNDTEPVNCDHTRLITCPHCGYMEKDSWEFGGDDGPAECPRCEKRFHVAVHISVTYSTRKDGAP